ncbi:MAG: DMT family transporter [Pirellulales bacterium]
MAYFYFLFICAVWGSNFLLMKYALLAFGPISVGACRVVGGAITLAAVWYVHHRQWPALDGHLRPMLFVVAMGYIWPFTMQPYLIGIHGSGFIGMMVCLVPLLTIVVSVPMLHVWPSPRQLIGVVGGFACMALIAKDGSVRNVPWYDLLLAISVPLNYAISNTYIKKRFSKLPPLAMALLALTITSGVLLPLAVGLNVAGSESVAVTAALPLAVTAAIVLGILGTGVTQLFFMKLVQEQGPLFAGMVTYLIPVIAVLLGWLNGEAVTRYQAFALVGVLLMVGVVQYKAAVPREPG